MAKKKIEAAPVEEAVDRGNRKVRTGVVSSNKMTKTVVVKIVRRVQHPLYGKTMLKTQKFKAHAEESELGGKVDEGAVVEIVETRPLSKEKHWRVSRIIEKVK